MRANQSDEKRRELELAWVSAAIDDAHRSGWGELLRSWLWEIAADSLHGSD